MHGTGSRGRDLNRELNTTQRYVYVCRALEARRWCTIENSLRAVAVIYVVAVLYQLCRFV